MARVRVTVITIGLRTNRTRNSSGICESNGKKNNEDKTSSNVKTMVVVVIDATTIERVMAIKIAMVMITIDNNNNCNSNNSNNLNRVFQENRHFHIVLHLLGRV